MEKKTQYMTKLPSPGYGPLCDLLCCGDLCSEPCHQCHSQSRGRWIPAEWQNTQWPPTECQNTEGLGVENVSKRQHSISSHIGSNIYFTESHPPLPALYSLHSFIY